MPNTAALPHSRHHGYVLMSQQGSSLRRSSEQVASHVKHGDRNMATCEYVRMRHL